ncbi:16S rRNA (cytidine1402-2'-O)-methyltransferase [Caloranaerobacter azorensis DSM 13643]|uniref:Ribosomal RNA small subunit methyltransferase I n=1 Tax=Caloranaerobacter azorensis DSM 13643 TaxID=1121264 RepID=A0A1M5T6B6_9FIRM|nr:16S rRNA (cytidine(1402)-2'-O)-methyltransferase [Caloranaerobacter azorensis]SHH46295.1 16S rRNA (cytidine1402-2'-O)-methyltransferase [Caloranaerobacter azorensis DSM 13643]
MLSKGVLYVCPTPIGNLEDITIRVLNVLKSVDLIAAEDTRHTLKLLNHYDIKKPLTSYHEHNMKQKGKILIDKLLKGENIALVSDAGMPGISDPGEDLIRLAIENGVRVVGLPGSSASLLALVISGLPTNRFVFEGFLPSNKKERRERLNKIRKEDRTIIFYEAPHRLINSLKDMNEILGDRKIAVARELTKRYEEIFRGTLKEAIDKFQKDGIKGEFVLVIEGAKIEDNEFDNNWWADITVKEHILFYINKGLSKKDAIKMVAKERNIPKRDVYKESLSLEL